MFLLFVQREDEKQQQDLLIDRLQNKIDQLKEDIALYEAQIVAQEAEMITSQSLLNEAEAQIVSINVDKKHLMSQWNISLQGLQRRTEAFNSLNKAYRQVTIQPPPRDPQNRPPWRWVLLPIGLNKAYLCEKSLPQWKGPDKGFSSAFVCIPLVPQNEVKQ